MELTRNAGERVLPLIRRAEEELTVCSPFISPKFAELLVEKSDNGTDVELFTAEASADYHRRSLQILQKRAEASTTGRDAGLALVFLGVLGIPIAYFLGSLALIMPLALLAGSGYLLKKHLDRTSGRPEPAGKIDVQIVEDLHAKLYSRDGGEEIVFGSANLTRNGMWKNLEVVSGSRNKPSPREREPKGMYA